MKTLTELNAKWWYRLLKVLYLLFAALMLLVIITVTVDEFSPSFDDEASYVQCNDGRQFPVDKVGMYSDYITFENDEFFRFWCATTFFDKPDGTKGYSINEGASINAKNYTFVAKETSRDWVATIGYSFLAIVIVALITEILRRILYYIILGTIRPKKGENADSNTAQ